MKRFLSIFLKTVISVIFIFLVIRKVDISAMATILKHVNIYSLLWILFLNYTITFFMALRWYYILYEFREKLSFFNVWKLSLVGLFFNVLLPTGAGGDAVKILYITKGENEKLKLGTSVIFDRFIGSSTIVLMAIISLLTYQRNLPGKLKITLVFLLILVLFIWLLILSDKLAVFTGKIFPGKIRQKLKIFYTHLRNYGINGKILTGSIFTSIFVQLLSIYVQYLCSILVSQSSFSPVPFHLFFVFIPMIWLSSMIPSLGGLGIREYGYLFFFHSYLGKDAAVALSIINLLLIFSQAFLGGLIFLFFRPSRQ